MGRLRRVNLVGVAVLAAAAWAFLLLHRGGESFLAVFLMWNVMMVAMMLPALLPWLDLFGRSQVPAFAGGYFLVWASYCLAATALQLRLNATVGIAPRFGALVLVAAGAYQLTPLKEACLEKCRSPVGQLLTRWRSGRAWVFRTGLAHGLHCLGCCWMLMAVAFALGVMNFLWMAVLTGLVFAEKVLPRAELVSRAIGIALVTTGLGWLLAA